MLSEQPSQLYQEIKFGDNNTLSAITSDLSKLLLMLTMRKAILFAACPHLLEYVANAEKCKHVNDVNDQLSLNHIRDLHIGGWTTHAHGLSSGEMQWVGIRLELVSSPDMLILDEPTPGLFSSPLAFGSNTS